MERTSMTEAPLVKGRAVVAYVNGVAVDSEGREVEGAPKPTPDTDPSQQPHALAQLNTEERSAQIMATAFASALNGSPGKAAASASKSAVGEEEELPTLAELEAHIADMDAKSVKAMQKKDERKGAEPIYEARLESLKGA
jgi:hypothetical protein